MKAASFHPRDDQAAAESLAQAAEGRTSVAVDLQTHEAYRRACFWLGHFYALLLLWRLAFVRPPLPGRAMALEALVAMVLFYILGWLLLRYRLWSQSLDSIGFVIFGILMANNVFLVAWLPGEIQWVNFMLIQLGASVTFRSLRLFVTAQVLCLGVASLAVGHWVGIPAVTGNLFILLSVVLVCGLIWTYLRRLLASLTALRAHDRILLRHRARLIGELRVAISNVRNLQGLIPICSYCKRVRDDAGYWLQVEEYVRDRSEADFSHGICPNCRVAIEDELAQQKLPGGVPLT
jgi:hypothetical protein